MLNAPRLSSLGTAAFKTALHAAPKMNPPITLRDINNPSFGTFLRPAVLLILSTIMFDNRV